MADALTSSLDAYRRARDIERRRETRGTLAEVAALGQGRGLDAANLAGADVRARLAARDAPVGGRQGFSEREKIEMKMALQKLQAELAAKTAEIAKDVWKSENEKKANLIQLAVSYSNQAGSILKQGVDVQGDLATKKLDARVQTTRDFLGAGAEPGGSSGGVSDVFGVPSLDATDEDLRQAGGLVDAALGTGEGVFHSDNLRALNDAMQKRDPMSAVRLARGYFQRAGLPPEAADAYIAGDRQMLEEMQRDIPHATEEIKALRNAEPLDPATLSNLQQHFDMGHAKYRREVDAQKAAAKARSATLEAIDARGVTGGHDEANLMLERLDALGLDDPNTSVAEIVNQFQLPNVDDMLAQVDALPSPEAPLTDSFSVKERIMRSPKFAEEFNAQASTGVPDPEAFFKQRVKELAVQARQKAAAQLQDRIVPGTPSPKDARAQMGETIAGHSNQLSEFSQ